MRSDFPGKQLLLKIVLIFVCVLYFGSAISLASDAPYHISGYVLDKDGNGVPGATVTLGCSGTQVQTINANPTTTVEKGNRTGYYEFDLNRSLSGEYNLIVEKNHGISYNTLSVSGTNYSYNVTIDYIASPTASPTLTVTPTAEATPSPTAIPSPSGTPRPTPGLLFALIPALAVFSFMALRTRK